MVSSSGLSGLGEFGSDKEYEELGDGVSKGTCFEIPELSASIIVESSVRTRGGPGEGVRSIGIAEIKINTRFAKMRGNTYDPRRLARLVESSWILGQEEGVSPR